MQFHVITAKDNKPIANRIIKALTSDGEMTAVTDDKGFVNLGPFSDRDVVTVEIEGYENLAKDFAFSNAVDFMTLEMTPIVSKIPYHVYSCYRYISNIFSN